jgi:tetratricopeptide (TPR) repeat protein
MSSATTNPDGPAQAAQDELLFESVVRSYVENARYLLRPWLATRLDEKLTTPSCRFVLITGPPGVGKSAFVAGLAQQHPDWCRYFIRRDQHRPLAEPSAENFLLMTGLQLTARRPELFDQAQVELAVYQRLDDVGAGSKLVGAEIERVLSSPFRRSVVRVQQEVRHGAGTLTGLRIGELVSDPRLVPLADLQFMALIDPARALLGAEPDARLVLLLDGLDELRHRSPGANLLDWLATCPALPTNVRIVTTCRADDALLAHLRTAQAGTLEELALDPDDTSLRDDVATYARALAREPAMAAALASGRDGDAFVTSAIAHAHGNLGYLDAVARAVDQGVAIDDQELVARAVAMTDLPQTLEEVNAAFLEHVRSRVEGMSVEVDDPHSNQVRYLDAWSAEYAPILGVLSVARVPLTFAQIRALGGIRSDGTPAMRALGQFLEKAGDHYRLYHATLAQFLTDPAAERRDLYLDPRRSHARILRHYRGGASTWSDVDWTEVDDYGLTHLPVHALGARQAGRRPRDLFGLIVEPFMRAKFHRFGTHGPFAADIGLAVGVAREVGDLVEEVRGTLCRASLSELANDLPGDLLAALVHMGQQSRAETYVALNDDPGRQAEGYLAIAGALAEQGRIDEVEVAARQAQEAAERNDYEYTRARLLCRVADVLIVAGARDAALNAARAAAAARASTGSYEGQEELTPAVAAVLGRCGAPDEALAVAASANKAADAARRELACALADVGDGGHAFAVAQDIFGEGEREGALTAVIERVGDDVDALLAAARRLGNLTQRSHSLSGVAWMFVIAGDTPPARSAAEEAVELARSLNAGHEAADCASKAVEVLAAVGDVDRALDISRGLTYQLHRDRALTAVAVALAEAGAFDQAASVAGEVSEWYRDKAVVPMVQRLLCSEEWDKASATVGLLPAHEQLPVLTRLAHWLADAGEWDRSVRTAERLRELAAQLGHMPSAGAATAAEAYARVCSGDIDAAIEVVGRFSPDALPASVPIVERMGYGMTVDQQRLDALTTVATVVAEAGQPDIAIQVVRLMQWAHGFPDALSSIARALLSQERPDEAIRFAELSLALAGEIDNESLGSAITTRVIDLLGEADAWERAAEVARAAGDEFAADKAVEGLIGSLVAKGRCADALDALAAIGVWSKARAQAEIARGFASVGDWDRAVTLAFAIGADESADRRGDDIPRRHALSEIALELARAGRFDQVRAVVDDFLLASRSRFRSFQAVALADIALALGTAGMANQCAELAERALATASVHAPGHSLTHQLTCAATALVVANRADRARDILGELEIARERSTAFANIAGTLNRRAMHEAALQMADHAIAAVEAEDPEFEVSVAESERAIALAGLGSADEAVDLIARIRNPHKQELAIMGTAARLVAAGCAGRLYEVARGMDSTYRPDAMKAISSALDDSEEWERIEPKAAELVGNEGLEVLCPGARCWVRTGQRERAGELIGRAKVAVERPGRLDRALQAIRAVKVPTDNGTNRALADIAPQLVRAGRVEDLRDTVVQLGISAAVVEAVCGRLTSAGHVDAALLIWRMGLDKAGKRDGAAVFDVIAAGATTLAQLDGGETLWSICQAAFDVDDWWSPPTTPEHGFHHATRSARPGSRTGRTRSGTGTPPTSVTHPDTAPGAPR